MFWLAGQQVAVGVAERTEREAEREQGDQDPSDAVDQGHAAGALDRLAAD